MIVIDGSEGEGGGQVLRTALALSMVGGKPFRLERIRARRAKPGLQRQHLTAVLAAAKVSQATLAGAEMHSQQLTFTPGEVRPGEYVFSIGTAGSATLVLQTVLPPLLTASGPSQLRIEGGTHNTLAPPFEFFAHAFLPLLNRMGPVVEADLVAHGFYPAGGGRVDVKVQPAERLQPLDLLERGRVVGRQVRAIVSRLPLHIAEREAETVRRGLGWPADAARAEEVSSPGPGNAVLAEIQAEHVTEVFIGFGERGVPAEKVAAGVVREARRWLEAGVPVSEHLADQLLLPLALAGGGQFRSLAPSGHTQTNAATIQKFLDVAVAFEQQADDDWLVRVVRPT